MTIESISKKIESKAVKLDKKYRTLARMEKKAENYADYEFECVKEDIEKLKNEISNLKLQIEDEQIRAANRNIPVLVEFLNMWRDNAREWYLSRRVCKEREEARVGIHAAYEAYYSFAKSQPYMFPGKDGWEEFNTKRNRLHRVFEEKNERYQREYSEIIKMECSAANNCRSYEDELEVALQYEWNRKYDDLIAKVEKITGKITDCSYLRINGKSDIDGFIEGEKGKAEVNTFGAGGYNIQCFHYRTKIKAVK